MGLHEFETLQAEVVPTSWSEALMAIAEDWPAEPAVGDSREVTAATTAGASTSVVSCLGSESTSMASSGGAPGFRV